MPDSGLGDEHRLDWAMHATNGPTLACKTDSTHSLTWALWGKSGKRASKDTMDRCMSRLRGPRTPSKRSLAMWMDAGAVSSRRDGSSVGDSLTCARPVTVCSDALTSSSRRILVCSGFDMEATASLETHPLLPTYMRILAQALHSLRGGLGWTDMTDDSSCGGPCRS